MYSFVEKRAPVFAFGNTNNLALFITFALLLLFPMLFDESKLKKLTYIGLAVLSFPILLMTDSRANVIGLIIGIAVYMGFKMKRRITKAQTVLLFMALSAVILFFVLFWDNISNSLYEFFYFTGQKSSESISNISRTNSLKNAFLMIINSLGFGVGCGNSAAAANHVYNTLGVYDLHNWWLLILTEYGAVVGIAYYAVYFSQVKKLFKFIREEENDDYKQTMISFAAIDIAFVLCLLSPSSVVAIEWLWVYWGIRFSWINRYSLCLYDVE
jgi:teichuronic acid biosynthesis protein TuaE